MIDLSEVLLFSLTLSIPNYLFMPNHLINESSPYLLQHAYNPVNWYPWTEEAFEIARRENKPVLVSIGYAACHWCHVMEKESFEDQETAELMNALFINVKVDREEHPDVDHFYMDALQVMTGQGGWPLNMFVTPNKKPFYGGTYFPPVKMYNRLSWKDILIAVATAWKEKTEEIEKQSEELLSHINQHVFSKFEVASEIQEQELKVIAQQLLSQADTFYGGFGQAPKFPSTMAIRYLLQFNYFNQDSSKSTLAIEAKQHAILSLDKMIDGGIYDQIGGGFCRYATDEKWRVPHFEKMLYDNALMIGVLADAYWLTGNQKYHEIVAETIQFCKSELSEGDFTQSGFYSSLDADSEGEEGKYYVWTYEEFQEAVGDLHPAFTDYYGVTKEGNWEDEKNILYRAMHRKELLVHYSLPLNEWYSILKEGKKRLLEYRSSRPAPRVDDKMLLSWNACMNISLCSAATAFQNNEYKQWAEEHLNWMIRTFLKDDFKVMHAYKNGRTYIEGNLDDYAYLLKALLTFSSLSGQLSFIKTAEKMMQQVYDQFYDAEKGFFHFSSKEKTDILVKKIETEDTAMPSSNAVMVDVLYLLGEMSAESNYITDADRMLFSLWSAVQQYPLAFSHWAAMGLLKFVGRKHLLILGEHSFKTLQKMQGQYFPHIYLMSSEFSDNEIFIMKGKESKDALQLYLCTENSCGLPKGNVTDMIEEIKINCRNIV